MPNLLLAANASAAAFSFVAAAETFAAAVDAAGVELSYPLLLLNCKKDAYMCPKMMEIYADCNLEVQRYCEPFSQVQETNSN